MTLIVVAGEQECKEAGCLPVLRGGSARSRSQTRRPTLCHCSFQHHGHERWQVEPCLIHPSHYPISSTHGGTEDENQASIGTREMTRHSRNPYLFLTVQKSKLDEFEPFSCWSKVPEMLPLFSSDC